jgi:Domain of unknown function (DUF4345)
MLSTKIRCVKLARAFTITNKERAVLGKVILWISAIVFIPYGLLCLFNPSLPAGYAGLTMGSGDAFAEIGAMYGGLQTGFGLFCLLGALRTEFFRPALTALLLVVGGLALGRLYSTATSADPVGGYTWAAMAYEFTTATLAGLALRKT